jgi:condensin complex subunit 1
MSHFVFAIPLQRDDLFEAPTRNQYVVENVYNTRDLKIQLQDLQVSVREQGANFVLSGGFDVVFSLLGEFNTGATSDMKQKGIEITMTGMASLVDQLSNLLGNAGQHLAEDERLQSLNQMKMILYLLCQLTQKVENEQSIFDPVTGGKAKGGKKKTRDDDTIGNWEFDRPRIVSMIYNLFQLNLNLLFEPPVMEDEVLDLVGFTLFKICENPTMGQVKCKDIRLSLIQVLGTMNKKFNYTHSCCLKMTQELKQHEHLVTVFSQATEMFTKEFGCTGMVMEMVREISRVDMKVRT